MIGEGSKSFSAPKKGKGNETTFDVAVAVASEDVKVHRPEWSVLNNKWIILGTLEN